MPGEKPETPEVIVFPPVIAIGTVVVAVVLQWLWPLGQLAAVMSLPLRIGGALLFVAGLLLVLGAILTMKRIGTNIAPSQPATTLADFGVFRLTRNPMYVGGSLMMVALALCFSIDWLLILFIPSQLLLHYGVIRPEERYLASRFGQRYLLYTSTTPRYLLFF